MPAHSGDSAAFSTSTHGPKFNVKDEMVISGISARLPESDNLWEFRDHLFNGEDMVTEDDRRWPPGLHGLPTRNGKLKDLSAFDAGFFGVHAKQAHVMDPQLRLLLELTYEAIVDAGIDPQSIRGTKTGVYIGASTSESEEAFTSDPETINGYALTGCCRAMFANRISFQFDFKGPSFALDTACSSSLLAFDQALTALRTGQCDYAVVGGVNICLKPTTSLQFHRLGMLSAEGKCKAFDATGAGYVRSEAASVIFLQRSSTAKRVYATVVHSKSNTDGSKQQGVTYPSGQIQKTLLEAVYKEAGVNPNDVVYIEAHGTGTKVGDPEEVNSIAEVFCQKRDNPLLIGSVKSNMGHSEPASGMCSIAKVLIAMETGKIPANLHFKVPNPNIPALNDGRLKVVSEAIDWHGGLVGINSFGFGGANAHVILRSNPKPKSSPLIEGLKIFAASARTEEGVGTMLDHVETSGDQDLYGLMTDLMDNPQPGHSYRGYTILNGETTVKEIQKTPNEKPPVWFIFSGMGTQWVGMGRDLMNIDTFKKSILHLHDVLKPYKINLTDLITNSSPQSIESTLNNFVTIAAIQIALVDTLRALGVEPDGMIGHSVGELGCSYADGCFTAEQMILAAYWRGKCVEEANLDKGAMAAVGLTWEEVKRRCPKGVVPACHNSTDSVTISGEAKAVEEFVEVLKSEDIFAKTVNSSNIAFHCHYMSKIAPILQSALEKVIPTPKARSQKWISSSIAENKWSTPLAKTCSAMYHVNNLVSPVLFKEALEHVPKNAVVVEIAPHCLLQAILKRAIGSEACFVGLMKRDHSNNLQFFLSNLGKLYLNGVQISLSKLYRSTSFPVPRGTSMIAPLVRWDHSQKWTVAKLDQFLSGGSATNSGSVVEIDVSSPESKDYYLIGHTIDGRVLFPATGYLQLAWKAFAKVKGVLFENLPVKFTNVALHRATILPKTGSVKFQISIIDVTGQFEIAEGGSLAVSGHISILDETEKPIHNIPKIPKTTTTLNSNDVYKELRLRGYEYGSTFQGVHEASKDGGHGKLKWNGNWVSFLDTMLQFSILAKPSRLLCLPTSINLMKIDPIRHLKEAEELMTVASEPYLNYCTSGGVEILGLKASIAPRRQGQQAAPLLEEYHFVPYCEKSCFSNHPINTQLDKNNAICTAAIATGIKNWINNHSHFLPPLAILKSIHRLSSVYKSNKDKSPLSEHLAQLFSLRLNDDFPTKSTELINQLESDDVTDELLTSIQDAIFIKPLVDVVRENCSLSKLKIVEAESKSSKLCDVISGYLLSQPLMNIDYVTTTKTIDENQDGGVVWDPSEKAFNTEAHLVVGRNLLSRNYAQIDRVLQNVGDTLKTGGFAILIEWSDVNPIAKLLTSIAGREVINETGIIEAVERNGLKLIGQRSDGFLYKSYLVRKTSDILEPITLEIDEEKYKTWVEELKDKMKEVGTEEKNLWVTSKGQPTSGVVGLVNCLRQEENGHKIRCVFDASLNSTSKLVVDQTQWSSIVSQDLVMNIFRDGKWGRFSHLPLHNKNTPPKIETEHAYVNIQTRGDLSSLRWFESPLKYFAASPTSSLCHVYYAPLNFRDVMLATGKLPPDALPGDLAGQDCIMGLEFSGRDENGKRIMGLLPAKGMATTVEVDPEFLWSVPDHWSLEDASTVPVVYSTVYYALVIRGQLRRGESVLIHSGSGGVGQAAISVALSLGCVVYTTVGSVEKKDYLKKRFPQLKEENFANSRDTSFQAHVMMATKGKGVDVVLNSLSEEKLTASVRCLANHGRFLEIGKFDLSNDAPLGMGVFLKNVTFHGILLDALFEKDNPMKPLLVKLIDEGIKNGAVQPLARTVFPNDQLETAFRYMATGKHVGKVVLKIRDEEKIVVKTHVPYKIPALRRVICNPDKTYVITGGLGGFGLELAEWLVTRGARFLVLSSRSGVKTGYQKRCIDRWERQNVEVRISTANVATVDGAKKLLSKDTEKAVGGIFNLAMVLRDAVIENQSVDDFKAVGDPKIKGTKNLDEISRDLYPDLDWFVVFSSVSCGRGNVGQTNYALANSAMERICEARRRDGLAGLAIQWGAIGDVGVVQETMGGNEVVVGGTLPQRIGSCLTVLEGFLTQDYPVVASLVLAEKQGKSDAGSGKVSLVDAVANILGVKESSSMNEESTLADLGMDSLMGVEIKQTLERDFDLVLSAQEIRQLTIGKLKIVNAGGSLSENGGQAVKGSGKTEAVKIENDVKVNKVIRYNLPDLVPNKCIVALNTVTTGRPLFVVHPIEGNTSMLTKLAAGINSPVFGIECGVNAPLKSLKVLATHYVKEMKSVQAEPPYNLAGYSMGGAIAYEMALQLQEEYKQIALSALIFLDASHSYVSAQLEDHAHAQLFEAGQTGEAETNALLLFLMQFVDMDLKKVRSAISSYTSWNERVAHVVDILLPLGFSTNRSHLQLAAEMFYHRLLNCLHYKPHGNIRLPVTLIRAKDNAAMLLKLGKDYSLGKVCGNVRVETIDGNHNSFLETPNVTKACGIVNEVISESKR